VDAETAGRGGDEHEQLRDSFLIADIFGAGELRGVFTALDRLVVGGAMPLAPLQLPNHPKTGRAFFLERRELGAINVGGPGTVQVDGKSFRCRGWGACMCRWARARWSSRARMRKSRRSSISELPGPRGYPAAVMKKEDATAATLGSQANANRRTIHKYIHAGGIASCQLVMGFTELAEGSVWNSFPPHTHDRRAEIYFYFDLGESALLHLMGRPRRPAPLHAQPGGGAFASVVHPLRLRYGKLPLHLGMAGENQTFDDMDGVGPTDLR